jgi:hypothetical protein
MESPLPLVFPFRAGWRPPEDYEEVRNSGPLAWGSPGLAVRPLSENLLGGTDSGGSKTASEVSVPRLRTNKTDLADPKPRGRP